jgi:DNA polymerase III subunit delta'
LDQLRGALRSGKVHHAWIFHGPVGVGKFTAAAAFARLLLQPSLTPEEMERFEPANPGGRPASSEGRIHPDLHVLNRDSAQFSEEKSVRDQKRTNIPLAVLRQFMIGGMVGEKFFDGPANTAASQGGAKVFIVDEAEYLDSHGQNAMLKTLEEPPPRTYFVLIAAQPEWLLPTVRSRCQRVGFQPLSKASMEAWFARSEVAGDARTRAWLAEFAEGSPGVAEIAATFDFAAWYETLAPQLAQLDRGRFPPALAEDLNRFASEYADAVVKKSPLASKDAANKDAVGWLMRLMAMYVRQGLSAAAEQGDADLRIRVMDLLQDAERQIGANVNQKLGLYNLLAQWHSAARTMVAT